MQKTTLKTILLIIFTLIRIKPFNSKSVSQKSAGCYMPEGCAWYKPDRDPVRRNLYCKSLYASLDTLALTNNTLCSSNLTHTVYLTLHFNHDKSQRRHTTLNNSFQLHLIANYMTDISRYFFMFYFKLFSFYNLNGFDVNLTLNTSHKTSTISEFIFFQFFDTDLHLVTSSGTLIRTCEQYQESFDSTNKRNVFFQVDENSNQQNSIAFDNCRSLVPVCRLLFRDSSIDRINMGTMAR